MLALKAIFEKIENEKLILPDFQRDFKWTTEKQKSLLASLLLNFPIGSSLIVKGNSTEFSSRKIGDLEQTFINDSYECEYLLDGQQRTTSLYNAFNNLFALERAGISKVVNEDEYREKLIKYCEKKANSMKVRWFVKVPIIENEDVNYDIFNCASLNFDKRTLDSLEPEDISESIEGFTFNERHMAVKKWYSPFFEQTEKSNGMSQRRFDTLFVEESAMQGFLPLYLIGQQNGRSIFKRILARIAELNARSIQDSIEESIDCLREYDVEGVLDSYSSIEDMGEEKEEILQEIFSAAQERWVTQVFEYFTVDMFSEYKITSIDTTDITRAIPIFCHINEGGMKLDDFDLLAARAARRLNENEEQYSLSKVVRDLLSSPLELSPVLAFEALQSSEAKFNFDELDLLKDGIPTGYIRNSILAICSLLSFAKRDDFFNSSDKVLTKDKAKSRALLSLGTQEIRDNIVIATKGVLRALAFLSIRCGVSNAKRLHYTLMLQPIAFAFCNDDLWTDKKCLDKLHYWYLTSLLSGTYLYDQSAVVIKDINLVYKWLNGESIEELIQREEKALKNPEYADINILTMCAEEAPRESVKSGILQFVLSLKPYDLSGDLVKRLNSFRVEDGFVNLLESNSHHDHHIMPVDLDKGLGETSDKVRNNKLHILNSPLNRVLISADANQKIGSLDPARYFEKLGESGSYNNQVLKSNLIPTGFKDIGTGSNIDEIRKVMFDRFYFLNEALENKLLELRTSFS